MYYSPYYCTIIHSQQKRKAKREKQIANSKSKTTNHMHNMKNQSAKPRVAFINVYDVTREYGGAEEGGWYYTQYSFIESRRIKAKFGIPTKKYMKQYNELCDTYGVPNEFKGEQRKFSGFYSPVVNVYVETKKAESQTIGRPYYN